MKKMSYRDIQNDAIKKYRVKICTGKDCHCWSRMHAHVRERRICKWYPKSSARATFDLLHEIGHIETYHGNMRRCESEYYATQWAADRAKEYGMTVPGSVRKLYQDYINQEKERGKRRGGQHYLASYEVKW